MSLSGNVSVISSCTLLNDTDMVVSFDEHLTVCGVNFSRFFRFRFSFYSILLVENTINSRLVIFVSETYALFSSLLLVREIKTEFR